MTYKTSDLPLASVLFELKHDLVGIDKDDPKKMYFIFEDSDRLQEDIKKFYDKQIILEASSLMSTYKNMKTRLYYV